VAVTDWPSWATERVEVHPPDDAWRRSGEQECQRLDATLGGLLVAPVEHVGSTAVLGLSAKPILDLQAAVADLDCASGIAAVLAPVGWHYVPPELDARPWRRFLVKVEEGHRIAHLHLMSLSHPRWRQQLAFRDALRADECVNPSWPHRGDLIWPHWRSPHPRSCQSDKLTDLVDDAEP